MAKLAPAKERARLDLYHAGLIDREIAAKLGLAVTTIQLWRNKRNLPPNSSLGLLGKTWGKKRKKRTNRITWKFLTDLSRYADMGAGRPDIGRFMKEWRRVRA